MNITPLVTDHIEYVRSRPAMYVGQSGFQPGPMAGFLCYSTALQTGQEAMLLPLGKWWCIGSRFDWIDDLQSTVGDVFQRLIAFPKQADNSFYHEILLTAFAMNVLSVTPQTCLQVKGSDQSVLPELTKWMCEKQLKRVIAYS